MLDDYIVEIDERYYYPEEYVARLLECSVLTLRELANGIDCEPVEFDGEFFYRTGDTLTLTVEFQGSFLIDVLDYCN